MGIAELLIFVFIESILNKSSNRCFDINFTLWYNLKNRTDREINKKMKIKNMSNFRIFEYTIFKINELKMNFKFRKRVILKKEGIIKCLILK
ncbi:MAG: hypothetical protein ACD_47C00182G0005 [uncultured bacterium]|nr:MAG: hypothetical protein ACD_47C00182G0005 [uncultured bacterium]